MLNGIILVGFKGIKGGNIACQHVNQISNMKLHLPTPLRRALAAGMMCFTAQTVAGETQENLAETYHQEPVSESHSYLVSLIRNGETTDFINWNETALHAYVGNEGGPILFARDITLTTGQNGQVTGKRLSIDKLDDWGFWQETRASSGLGLYFSGQVTLTGGEHGELGFEDGDYFMESSPSYAQIGKVETIVVEEAAELKMKDMDVRATHALLVSKHARLELDGVQMQIGGGGGTCLADHDGTLQTTGHHHTAHSLIKEAEINLKNGAELSFAPVPGHQSSVRMEDCTLKGTGILGNINMTGGQLIAGNSPGQLTLTGSSFNESTLSVYFITNPGSAWNAHGANNDTTHLLSNYKIAGAVTLNMVTFKVQYQERTGSGYQDTHDKSALRHFFQKGASITLFTGNLAALSGTYSFDAGQLPELADGLYWDVSRLLTTGQVFVVDTLPSVVRLYEPGAPVRIANTLLSAGATVQNFGHLAEKQAVLRARGTTRTWGSALGMSHRLDNQAGREGYQYQSWGGAVGVDYAFTNRTVAGLAFGSSRGEHEARRGNAAYTAGEIDQDAQMLGVYATHQFRTKGLMDQMKLSVWAAHGWFNNKSRRSSLSDGHEARAEWDSDAWVFSAMLSRDIRTDADWVFTPFAGVEYTQADMHRFTETGASGQTDYAARQEYRNLALKLGVGVSRTMGRFTPYAHLAYVGDIARDTPEVSATGQRTLLGKAAMPGRHALQLDLGMSVQLGEGWDARAGYSAELRDNASEQQLHLGVGYTF